MQGHFFSMFNKWADNRYKKNKLASAHSVYCNTWFNSLSYACATSENNIIFCGYTIFWSAPKEQSRAEQSRAEQSSRANQNLLNGVLYISHLFHPFPFIAQFLEKYTCVINKEINLKCLNGLSTLLAVFKTESREGLPI